MEKGQALPGQPRLPFGPASGPACLPLSLSPPRAAPALSQPASATWRPYAGEERATAGHLHPPWSGRQLGLPGHSIHPVARAPLPPPSTRERNRSRRAPPQRHRRSSSAAHRRPLQCPNHDTETTSAFAIVVVSSCERSTEVRARRAP